MTMQRNRMEIPKEGQARITPETNKLPERMSIPKETARLPDRISVKPKETVPKSPEDYRRPYLRENTRREIFENAPTNRDGKYLDPNTGKPIEGTPDIGHKPGHEHWREAKRAYSEGLTQEQFNDRMNNPDFYQLEDPSSNRSHKFEDKSPVL